MSKCCKFYYSHALIILVYQLLLILCALQKLSFQCNGQNIDWQLFFRLYEANAGWVTETLGVSIVHKLKHEHLRLTYFSKMRVDLAVQVIVFAGDILFKTL